MNTPPQFPGRGHTLLVTTQVQGPTHMSATVDASIPVVAAWEALAATGTEGSARAPLPLSSWLLCPAPWGWPHSPAECLWTCLLVPS